MDITVSFLNYSYVQVRCKDQSTHYDLRDYFSFEVEGYQFNSRFRYGNWDGKIRLFENNGQLPIGLVGELKKFASNMDYSIEVDAQINEKEVLTREDYNEWLSSLEIYSGGNKITPHWYQADAVFEGISNKRQILNLPTSAGKSLIACLLSRYYLENYTGRVLVIVPTTQLVTQLRDDFVDYQLFPSSAIQCIGGGKKANNPDALITSITWQSAVKQSPEWFLQFGMVIVDECHLSTGASISKIVKSLGHVPYKFGMSGSLRDGKANLLQYIGMFGDVFRPVTTKQLMDDGQVTDLKINAIVMRYNEIDCKACKGLDYQNEIKFINNHKARNTWICKLALKLAKNGENVFLMFRFTKHGKELYEALNAVYDNVRYISGESKSVERDAMKLDAENQKGMIVVASVGVLSTGVSIKNLHHIIFSMPTKSKIVVLQSIGRVLRKHESKEKAVLWDIIDNLATETKSKTAKNKYSYKNYALKHGIERIKRYSQEQFEYITKQVNL